MADTAVAVLVGVPPCASPIEAAESASTAHQDVAMIFGPGATHHLAAVFKGEEFTDA